MQKHVNLVDLVKSFPMNILLQNLASIQQRTSLIKFAHLAEKSEYGSISNLSTKVHGAAPLRATGGQPRGPRSRDRAPAPARRPAAGTDCQYLTPAQPESLSRTGVLLRYSLLCTIAAKE